MHLVLETHLPPHLPYPNFAAIAVVIVVVVSRFTFKKD
jgi:hypothetical protein